MSNEKNNVLVSDEEMANIFKDNDKTLMELVTRIKNIYANTLLLEKKEKINALRKELVNKDIKHQLEKINIINNILIELQ